MDISNRWREHSDELLNGTSEANQDFVDLTPCSQVKNALADVPPIEEVEAAASKSNCGKSPCIDGLQAEIFKCADLI